MTEKRQSIFRANHSKKNPYFQMLRTTAQDDNLSFEARGVMAYLLSQDEKWEINKADLMKRGGIGKTKLTRIVNELFEAEYMICTQENIKGEFQKVVYTLYEEPQPENRITVSPPEPLSEKPVSGNRCTGNQPQDIIKEESTKENKIIDQKIPATPPPPGPKNKPTEQQALFEAICKTLDYDLDKLTPTLKKNIGAIASELKTGGALPENVTPFWRWIKARAKNEQWKSQPSMHSMKTQWTEFAKTLRPVVVQHVEEPQWMKDAGINDEEPKTIVVREIAT